ncbi:MAG: hypothetical protein WBD74_12595 [Candidatus Aquilonibacter sp.]
MHKLLLLVGAACFAALANAPLLVRAADLTPSNLLANTRSYDGQPVSVQGTVKNFSTHKTLRGTISTFQVCDQQCVSVVDETGGAETNSADVTVSGSFHTTLQARRQTYTNVIVIQQ